MKQDMTNSEALDMMQRCSSEIKMLRALIAELQPKADAYDNMAALIGLLPKPSRGMGEDVCWTLDKRIQELRANPSAEAAE